MDKPISEQVFDWLADGEVGLSSKCLALTVVRGKPYVDGLWGTPYPHDPDDLRRCVLLLNQASDIRVMAFPILAKYSPYWAGLIPQWDELVKLFREEIGDEANPRATRAPKTYEAMRAILDPIQERERLRKSDDLFEVNARP